jgi:hypothetical protein
MPGALQIKGEDWYQYGDVGRVDASPILGPKNYIFQVGEGNSASATATQTNPTTGFPFNMGIPTSDPLGAVSKYLPYLIIGGAALLAAAIVLKKKR